MKDMASYASPAQHARRQAEQHWVQFYETDGFLAGEVTRFIADGLLAEEPAVIIATKAHRDAFTVRLRAQDLDGSQLEDASRLVMLDAEDTLAKFMVDGVPRWERFEHVVGGVLARLSVAFPGKSIRAYGEMVDVLWRRGEQDAAIHLEEMWNDLRGRYEFKLLCAYVMDSFYKEVGIPRICATHSHVLPPERRVVEDPRSIADTVQSLIAEIARRNEVEQALRDALRRAWQAEETARATKDDLEDFLDNAVIAIHRVDANGIIRWANRAELALVGYERHQYVGHHIAEFHVDRDVIDEMLARLGRGDTLHDYEARVRTKRGDIRVVHVSSNFQQKDGGTTRCFSRDVTDQKRARRFADAMLQLTASLSRAVNAEEAARVLIRETCQLVGASAGGVLLLDRSGMELERLLVDGDGHDPSAAASLNNIPLAAAMPVCEAARTARIVWVVGKDEIERRYPHLAALRETVSARTWGAVPIMFEGRVLGVIGFKCTEDRPLDRDEESLLLAVTSHCGQTIERARLHEAAQAARAEAEEANRAKDEFLAILGHELRNPLSPILTAVQLMRLRGETSSTREQNIIERQVTHLMHIVDDLLDISRVARGKIELQKRSLRLRALVAKAVEITSPLLEERRHRVEVIQPDEDIWLEADETRLCQVLTNLLSNAANYTPPQGQIELRVTREQDRVAIRVRDNGNGIAPDFLPRIFDLFVQGQRTREPQHGGLGIGLALVRNLVRLHGGSVRAHSDGPGRGSEFVVELPTIEVHTEAKPTPDSDWDIRQRVEVIKRRILVVDDNEDASGLLAEMLRSLGHEVVTAIDGPRALEVVNTFAPEIAILDIGLPVMDGYELAAALRQLMNTRVRLIAVSGYGQEQDKRRAIDAGFECHFVKPVSLQHVLAAIDVGSASTRS
jgi:PAS domain S-box-containing protein